MHSSMTAAYDTKPFVVVEYDNFDIISLHLDFRGVV